MRFKSAPILPVLLFAMACGSTPQPEITISVTNSDEYAMTGDIEIRVCSREEIDIEDLAVNLYVTENREWANLSGVQPYDEYFSGNFAGFPGDISNPIPVSLWTPHIPNCYNAFLEAVFSSTEDWLLKDRCPFTAIVIVASYRRGVMNGAEVLECSIGN